MRGNLVDCRLDGADFRSIPAYAGEPPISLCSISRYRVYPRVCGGTAHRRGKAAVGQGLSPRMRGNRRLPPSSELSARSIPAYAGEPHKVPVIDQMQQVYPRVCGGTQKVRQSSPTSQGLSPRMRGNPARRTFCQAPMRSIPAYAGEPYDQWLKLVSAAVYPRVCGGT